MHARLLGLLGALALVFSMHASVGAVAQETGKPKAAAKSESGAAPATGAGDLRARVEQLEEQLVDMQVTIGTLESLARSGGAAGRTGGGGLSAAESGRLDSLETQIRALTAQLEQLASEVRQSGGQPQQRGEVATPAPAPGAATGAVAPSAQGAASAAPFGSTTVTPGQAPDDIGTLLGEPGPGSAGRPPAAAGGATTDSGTTGLGTTGLGTGASELAPVQPAPGDLAAVQPAPADPSSAKQLYETAYGYLLQRDYGAAQTAFDDFLQRYPNDSLAGNAQYWLGESHYVRGDYKDAAGAFLKGYKTYASSAKAPDSLLKLAMSLDRLGQKDAACSSYAELDTRFPNAPASVKARAQAERQRVGCP